MKLLGMRGMTAPRSWVLPALLIAGAMLPASAQGACSSHDVTARVQPSRAVIDLELLSSAGALPRSHSEADRNLPGRRPIPIPCSGAFCSGNPAPAAPSVDTGLSLSDDPWAIAASGTMLVTPDSAPFPLPDAIRRPDEPARSIFRPPPALQAHSTP